MAALEKIGNYTLGRGAVMLARKTGAGIPNGARFVGNCPALGITVEAETLDHFSSVKGINELDASVQVQTTRSGTFTLDDIQPENLALFMQGSAAALIQAVTAPDVALLRYDIADVQLGEWYQIGQTDSNPVGATDLENVTVGDDAYVAAQIAPRPVEAMVGNLYPAAGNYDVNADLGLIRFKGNTIVAGSAIRIYYTLKVIPAGNDIRTRVITGGESAAGLMRFMQQGPRGTQRMYTFPAVTITANGEFALLGDEWQSVPFGLRIEKPVSAEAVYIDRVAEGVDFEVDPDA